MIHADADQVKSINTAVAENKMTSPPFLEVYSGNDGLFCYIFANKQEEIADFLNLMVYNQ